MGKGYMSKGREGKPSAMRVQVPFGLVPNTAPAFHAANFSADASSSMSLTVDDISSEITGDEEDHAAPSEWKK